MTLDAQLLEILVCPNDHGELDYHEKENYLECRTCHYKYPVRDDIPVMLIDEAEKPS
jgi:uncharacterized protein YbaR (Trm112 family)